MYAVIKTGGKQYRVNEGDVLRVEKLGGEVGGTLQLPVLMLAGGAQIQVGQPLVQGAAVEAEITGQGRHPKVIHFHKRKEGYTYKRGHRQPFTELKITAIHSAAVEGGKEPGRSASPSPEISQTQENPAALGSETEANPPASASEGR